MIFTSPSILSRVVYELIGDGCWFLRVIITESLERRGSASKALELRDVIEVAILPCISEYYTAPVQCRTEMATAALAVARAANDEREKTGGL